jgi:hypothetical protein
MTLVIASIKDGIVNLTADTMLSYPEKSGKKSIHGLKIFFLDDKTAIAYAGAAGEIAHRKLYAIYHQGQTECIEFLANQICKSFDDETHFLLARAGHDPSIVKVAEGRVSARNDGTFWIGDVDAANFVLGQQENTSGIYHGFKEAIESRELLTVGGHLVAASGTLAGFKFTPYMNLTTPYYLPADGMVVDFGSAETGGFGYTTVTPVNPGVNGWGIFYFQGRFGLFWHADFDKDICELLRVRADNVFEFIKVIEEELGIELTYCGSLG